MPLQRFFSAYTLFLKFSFAHTPGQFGGKFHQKHLARLISHLGGVGLFFFLDSCLFHTSLFTRTGLFLYTRRAESVFAWGFIFTYSSHFTYTGLLLHKYVSLHLHREWNLCSRSGGCACCVSIRVSVTRSLSTFTSLFSHIYVSFHLY